MGFLYFLSANEKKDVHLKPPSFWPSAAVKLASNELVHACSLYVYTIISVSMIWYCLWA